LASGNEFNKFIANEEKDDEIVDLVDTILVAVNGINSSIE
jgi:hypothetical protein